MTPAVGELHSGFGWLPANSPMWAMLSLYGADKWAFGILEAFGCVCVCWERELTHVCTRVCEGACVGVRMSDTGVKCARSRVRLRLNVCLSKDTHMAAFRRVSESMTRGTFAVYCCWAVCVCGGVMAQIQHCSRFARSSPIKRENKNAKASTLSSLSFSLHHSPSPSTVQHWFDC